MKLRDRRAFKEPQLMIIPMIDIMFFMLVFFMLGTLYMIEQRTFPVNLPSAQNSSVEVKNNFVVTLKTDGSIYLDDKQIELANLLQLAAKEKSLNSSIAIVLRADKDVDYGKVIMLIDSFKNVGIQRFSLATQKVGGDNEQ